jgi:hypothetical protein
MAKRIVWKNGDLVSLKLRDDLHTIGQMLTSPAMRFYKIKSSDGNWANIDLNKIEPLFRVFIGREVLQKLVDRKIPASSVTPSVQPEERLWIKPYLNYGGPFPFKGGKLIELNPESGQGTASAPVVKENLNVATDRDLIEKHELTNMWGEAELRGRLTSFFDKALDLDEMKEKVFPELKESAV